MAGSTLKSGVCALLLLLGGCAGAPAKAPAAAPAAAATAQAQSFTIAVIPDTQNYLDYTHQKADGFAFDAGDMFLQQMQFIADNLVSNGGDIAFVTSLGDVWQHQTLEIDPAHAARGFQRVANPILDSMFAPTDKVNTVEMPLARKGFDIIAGKTPFSVVPGNHDFDAMWTDARHPPKAQVRSADDVGKLHGGGLNNFKSVFSASSDYFRGKDWYVAANDDGADSAQIFEAGGYRFLHIGLQFDPPNSSLEWAASVVRSHPGLPTIVSTHDFLNNDGERLANPIIDHHALDPEDNNPQMVWEKFLSQHDQIFLVLSGHHHGQAMRIDDNVSGRKVVQVLADYQDRQQTAKDVGARVQLGKGIGDGWMRLMTFNLAGERPAIAVRTYSTHYRLNSLDAPQYAAWYKAAEKPKLSDADFLTQDNFVIPLPDFHERFASARTQPSGQVKAR